MSEEVKPCPFCGADDPENSSIPGFVYCRSCSASVRLEDWQKRPVEDSLRLKLASLEKELKVSDELLAERNRILDAIPCPAHGQCVPHVLDTFERYKAALEKIAAFGPSGDTGRGIAPWVALALNPQRAVEIAEEALSHPERSEDPTKTGTGGADAGRD